MVKYAQVAVDSIAGGQFQQIDYIPGSRWHTYRIEVQGDEAILFIDGTQISRSISPENALSQGPLGLNSRGLELRVSSFSITAL